MSVVLASLISVQLKTLYTDNSHSFVNKQIYRSFILSMLSKWYLKGLAQNYMKYNMLTTSCSPRRLPQASGIVNSHTGHMEQPAFPGTADDTAWGFPLLQGASLRGPEQ